MISGTQETGVEVLVEKEVLGVVQVDLSTLLHLGTRTTSNHHGEISRTSLPGVRGSHHFLHACRGRPISEDLSLLTSSHLLSISPLRPHTALDVFHLALCRKTFLPDITMTDHPIHHIDLTMLKENILEICRVLLPTTIPIRGFLHQVWELIILPGVEASTRNLAHRHMVLMAIHLTCVIASIQCKMIPVWCQMCPTLTCQLVSWLRLLNSRTVTINLWTLRTFGYLHLCHPAIAC